jgi:hypothetical protein
LLIRKRIKSAVPIGIGSPGRAVLFSTAAMMPSRISFVIAYGFPKKKRTVDDGYSPNFLSKTSNDSLEKLVEGRRGKVFQGLEDGLDTNVHRRSVTRLQFSLILDLLNEVGHKLASAGLL